MSPEVFLTSVLDPGLAFLASLGGPAVTDEARTFLLAVAGQESDCTARYQSSPSTSPGPARGYWQFEEGGGVKGVMSHSASASLAAQLCEDLNMVQSTDACWRALEGNDILAAGFARLLLFTDPFAIPTTMDEAWTCYADRLWRPGKPHPEVWEDNWNSAVEAVQQHPYIPSEGGAVDVDFAEALKLLQDCEIQLSEAAAVYTRRSIAMGKAIRKLTS